ncbi:MAG TPA: hypothetical protein VGL70_21630 [Candidatus Binatia bacterium]|jgi:hypothetical protein
MEENRAPGAQQGNKNRVQHGHYSRVASLKRHGGKVLDGRTWAGRSAKEWAAWALKTKGGKDCPLHIKLEIDAAAMDLWLRLELGEAIVRDAQERGSVLNRRRKELPSVHDQYQVVSMRFAKRCEALELDKGPRATLQELLAAKARENGTTREATVAGRNGAVNESAATEPGQGAEKRR